MTTNDCALWDFTLAETNKNNNKKRDLNILKDNLRSICKNWAFQLEKGEETEYLHYQGRISLLIKKRLNPLIKLFKTLPEWEGVRLSPTSKEVATTRNFNYVMKLDTRIEGPWTDKDEIQILTKQMELFKTFDLYHWQSELIKKANTFCMRSIDFIYDQDGNLGKSIFAEYMEFIQLGEDVPPYRLMDDIFQWVATRPIRKCYLFDMPRGMKKDKLADFYSGIEVIKNGVAYDKRNRATKVRFDRPRIFVFANTLPQFDLMSKDRWKVWTIYNKQLKEYSIDDECWVNDD